MFKRILVAARGEIALRIIRCCREMDIETVAVYSKADRRSLHAAVATASVCIGPSQASESYLRGEVLIEVALKTGCEAIHPGYGFLSENPEFAKMCEKSGLVFIGPPSDVISRMGDKLAARNLMKSCGVPVVNGSNTAVRDIKSAQKTVNEIGFPVLIKASAGGGGKGMRVANDVTQLTESFETAMAEAKAAFGNGDMYIEKYIEDPHHIEIQILADRYGNIVSLGERDCSIQKNNQKIFEETPSPLPDEDLRKRMNDAAIKAAAVSEYVGAGTVEFIVDGSKNFYFIEMNTRIQVEHPVTEETSGVDLIREQIRIACGMKLGSDVHEVMHKKHAMECRINALSSGTVKFLHFPAGYGVRIESHIYNGCEIVPYYDPLLVKVIVTGNTRLEAIRRMRRALEELVIEGIETNREFMHLMLYTPDFVRGRYSTGFYEKEHLKIDEMIRSAAETLKN